MKQKYLFLILISLFLVVLIGCQQQGKAVERLDYAQQQAYQNQYTPQQIQYPDQTFNSEQNLAEDYETNGYSVSQNSEEYYTILEGVELFSLNPSWDFAENAKKLAEELLGKKAKRSTKTKKIFDKNKNEIGFCITETNKVSNETIAQTTRCYFKNRCILRIESKVTFDMNNIVTKIIMHQYIPCSSRVPFLSQEIIIMGNSKTVIKYTDETLKYKLTEETIENEGKTNEKTTSTNFKYNSTNGRYEGYIETNYLGNECGNRTIKTVKYNETNQKIIKEIFVYQECTGIKPCVCENKSKKEITYTPFYPDNPVTKEYIWNSTTNAWEVKP